VRYDDVLLETDQELTFSCYMRHPGASYDWHAWMLAHDNVYDTTDYVSSCGIWAGRRPPLGSSEAERSVISERWRCRPIATAATSRKY